MDDFFKGVSGELKKIITSVSSFLTVIKKKRSGFLYGFMCSVNFMFSGRIILGRFKIR